MNNPQPIATAPHDGVAVISDVGIVMHMSPEECAGEWGYRFPGGRWVYCSPNGSPDSDSDYGVLPANPKLWIPLPEWMNT